MHIKIQEYVFYRRLLNCHQELIMPKTSRRLQQQRKSAKCHAEKYYNKSEYQLLSVTTCTKIEYLSIHTLYGFVILTLSKNSKNEHSWFKFCDSAGDAFLFADL